MAYKPENTFFNGKLFWKLCWNTPPNIWKIYLIEKTQYKFLFFADPTWKFCLGQGRYWLSLEGQTTMIHKMIFTEYTYTVPHSYIFFYLHFIFYTVLNETASLMFSQSVFNKIHQSRHYALIINIPVLICLRSQQRLHIILCIFESIFWAFQVDLENRGRSSWYKKVLLNNKYERIYLIRTRYNVSSSLLAITKVCGHRELSYFTHAHV